MADFGLAIAIMTRRMTRWQLSREVGCSHTCLAKWFEGTATPTDSELIYRFRVIAHRRMTRAELERCEIEPLPASEVWRDLKPRTYGGKRD